MRVRDDTSRLGPNYRKLFAATTISNIGDGIGVIAYPWLASAITRNPLLIALVAVVQRLPWLVFTLPAGVITDRVNRRSLMVTANAARATLTLVVAAAVFLRSSSLPTPDELAGATAVVSNDVFVYIVLLAATVLLGVGEVLYDNAGQTLMPAIVDAPHLERANGRMWSAEMVANTFVGPPLGALLIAVSFTLPFAVDAATFAVSAVLIALIPRSAGRREDAAVVGPGPTARASWRTELAEGFRWLWGHDVLRPMAIVLGLLNMLGMVSFSSFVLFGQEVLDTTPTEFAILGTGAAVGGIVGGWTAARVARRLGDGPALWCTFLAGAVTSIVIGLTSSWPLAWAMLGITVFAGTVWNVITVSLRQSVIPDRLLGRVNSVYRFFAWGMMPIGAALGGLIVLVAETFTSRETALRIPWFVVGIGNLALLAYAAPKLTTARIDAVRRAGVAGSVGTSQPGVEPG